MANQNESENNDLHLKVHSAEIQIEFLQQQLKFSQENQNDYLKKYEDAVSERSSLADEYTSRLASIQGQYTSLEDRYNKESLAWGKKYDQLVSNQKIEEEHLSDELASLRTRRSSTEARLSAAHDQIESTKEEAYESRQKHDLAIKEVQKTVENITAIKERAIQQAQKREDSLRVEFSATIAGKENKIQESFKMLEEGEKMQNGVRNQLKRVTDMAFFSNDVHLLASASSDGRVFIWKIEEGLGDDDKKQITEQIVFAIQILGDWESIHPHVYWHSQQQDVLFVGINNLENLSVSLENNDNNIQGSFSLGRI